MKNHPRPGDKSTLQLVDDPLDDPDVEPLEALEVVEVEAAGVEEPEGESFDDDAAGVDELLAESVVLPSLFLLDEDDEYRSEYQPPPFKMKPAPREICRLAA